MKLWPWWLSIGLVMCQIQEVAQAAALVPPGLSAVGLVRRPAMGKLLGCRRNGVARAPLLTAVVRTPVQRVRRSPLAARLPIGDHHELIFQARQGDVDLPFARKTGEYVLQLTKYELANHQDELRRPEAAPKLAPLLRQHHVGLVNKTRQSRWVCTGVPGFGTVRPKVESRRQHPSSGPSSWMSLVPSPPSHGMHALELCFG